MTPAQWLERAAHADAQAEQLAAEGRIAEAVVLSVQAQRYREVAEEMRRALTGKGRQRSISGMRVSESAPVVAKETESVKRGRARARRTGEAQEALYRSGWAVTDLATHFGEPRSTVSAWFAAGDLARPIPLKYAEKLERGIPTGAKDKDGKPVMLRIPRTNWAKLGR